ncbi:MAG TPA: cohesin domain-containing protein [Candidatus Bathyarchaeia archaeon]|nr:cohesin domain-containing protein [Candidatus Bathyarchaeia archaeon]
MPLERLIERPAGPAARGAAKRRLVRTACLVAATVALLGAAVVLDAPRQANEYLAYPVILSFGETEHVAGLQFDISLDADVVQLVDIEAGPAAINAGKDVVFSMLDDNTVRVLVVGLNQDELASGVVANLYVTPLQQSAGAPLLELGGAVVSDPSGNPVAPQEEPEAEEDSASNESFESSESDAQAAEAAAARDAETGGKDQPAASSERLMPAILDALLGDYGAPTARETAPRDRDGAQPASSGAGGSNSVGASGPVQPVGQDGYAAPGFLPPQVYVKGSSAGAAVVSRAKTGSTAHASPARVAGNVPGTPRPGGSGADAVTVGEPMRVSWARPINAPGPNGARTIASTNEGFDFRAYVNRRALVPAAACVAALVLVLRNAIAPLIRLLKDLVRS